MCELASASAEAGPVPPHDGLSAAYPDLEGWHRWARFARVLGCSGMHAIHPMQVPVIEAGVQPSGAELARTRDLLERWEAP